MLSAKLRDLTGSGKLIKTDTPQNKPMTQHGPYRIPSQEYSPSHEPCYLAGQWHIPTRNKKRKSTIDYGASRSPSSGHSECPEQNEILPLTGSPYFTFVVQKSHVTYPFHLVIPKGFRSTLSSSCVTVLLSCQNKKWEVEYHGDYRRPSRITRGWEHFALEAKLKMGDGCVFELIDSVNLMFKVSILGRQIPPELSYNDNPQSSNSPGKIE